ncbi:hypothetical protein HK100_009999, partial [Physocladia obscura]
MTTPASAVEEILDYVSGYIKDPMYLSQKYLPTGFSTDQISASNFLSASMKNALAQQRKLVSITDFNPLIHAIKVRFVTDS